MADQTKKIIFEAQDNGVASTQDRLKKGADEWARSLIRGAREYSTSAAEVIKYLEEEIKLAEKRDKQNAKFRQTTADVDYNRRMANTPEYMQSGVTKAYKAESAKISEEGRLDSIQVDLLRELIDTVKQTAREEISEDRKSVEDKLSKDKSLGRLGIGKDEDEIEALKKTLQYGEVGGIKENETSERNKFKFGAATGRGFNAAAGIAVQPNEFFMAAAALALIPVVGAGLSAIGSKMFSSAQSYETSLGQFGGMSGRGLHSTVGMGGGYGTYGLSASQAMNRAMQFARERGEIGTDKMFFSSLETNTKYMRGWGLGESDLLQNERLARGGRFLGGAVPLNLYDSLKGKGIMGNDTTLLPEYLQTLNQLGQQQIEVLGSIDQGVNTKMITAIAGMGGVFSNPDILKRVVPNLNQGLSKPVNAGIRALQLHTLQRSNPNMSLLELEMQQEQGLAGMDGTYLPEFLKTLKGRSGGGGDMFVRNIAGSFGLSLTMAQKIAAGFNSGSLSTEEIQGMLKESSSPTGDLSKSLTTRAEGNVGALEKSTAAINAFFEKNGERLVQSLEGIEKELAKWLDRIINGEGNPEKGMSIEERMRTQSEQKKEREKIKFAPYSYKFGSVGIM